MVTTIHFTKMSGAGNDFVVIDNRDDSLQTDRHTLAVALCSRHFGVGADGLLLLEKSSRADFSMQYYNADGSFGGMCGNGGRCIARYAFQNNIAGERMTFEALDRTYAAAVLTSSVQLHMTDPGPLLGKEIGLSGSIKLRGYFVDTGSPHFVTRVSNLNDTPVVNLGREVRYHRSFLPEGCNVNFVRTVGKNEVSIRTYERGVENETLACGTGCVAAAIVMAEKAAMTSPVSLHVRSGEIVKVHFIHDNGGFRNIVLEGSAHFVFSGVLLYDTETRAVVTSLFPKLA